MSETASYLVKSFPLQRRTSSSSLSDEAAGSHTSISLSVILSYIEGSESETWHIVNRLKWMLVLDKS